MPLSEAKARRDIHDRSLEMKAYQRDDGLYEVEAHLVDRKPFEFLRLGATQPMPAGQPLHDLWIRLAFDAQLVVREVEAASDRTPFGVCKEAQFTLGSLVGERIGRGWSARVKELLRGVASCRHLMEMLIPMATTALQAFNGVNRDGWLAADPEAVPRQLDTCYAFSREREVVQRLWPRHYRRREPG